MCNLNYNSPNIEENVSKIIAQMGFSQLLAICSCELLVYCVKTSPD